MKASRPGLEASPERHAIGRDLHKLPSEAELLAVMHIVPNSCTPEKGSAWRASCEWNGRAFAAIARRGASNALCRVLVEAGVPDQPMQVLDQDGKLRFTHRA